MVRGRQMKKIKIIDSHTGGEPTRVVVAGGPDLGDGPMAERLERFRERVRPHPLGGGERAARQRRHGGRAAVRTVGPDVRRGRDLLQQRRLPGHVRPRHHRAGGDAGAHGADRGRACTASKRPVGTVEARLNANGSGDHSQRGQLSPVRRRWRWTAPGIGDGARRYRLGRQLVLPVQRSRAASLSLDRRGAS